MIKNARGEATHFLAHPVFELGTPDHTLLATRYCPGGELYSRLKTLRHTTDSGIPKDVAKFYAANILEGLGQLHQLGIVYKE
jgi:serine/threonine protein kinase